MEKKQILEDLKTGKITVEEAEELLKEKRKTFDFNNFGEQMNNFGTQFREQFNEHIHKAMQFPDIKINIAGFGKKEEDDSNWNSVIKLAPFASAATLKKIIEKEIAKGENMNWKRLVQLAPFIDHETLRIIAKSALAEETPKIDFLIELAPFLGSELLMELIENSEGKIELAHIYKLAPFLDEKNIDALIEKFYINEE